MTSYLFGYGSLLDDRIYRRRPFIYTANASAIDKALKEGNVLQYVLLHDLRG